MTEPLLTLVLASRPRWASMIGLDSNILVRYLTQDDPIQSRRRQRSSSGELPKKIRVRQHCGDGSRLFRVLERLYWAGNAMKLFEPSNAFLQTDVLVVENEQEVFTAMIAAKEGRGSFADAVIAALGTRMGCSVHANFRQESAAPSGLPTSLTRAGHYQLKRRMNLASPLCLRKTNHLKLPLPVCYHRL